MQWRMLLSCPISSLGMFIFLTCCNLWLARNEWTFQNQSQSQHSLIYFMQAAMKFYFLAGTAKRTQVRLPHIIWWHVSPNPYIKINTDGSALGNPNMAELAAVRQGLAMIWNMGVKYIQLELDSKVVFTWLTNHNASYPTNMMSLICYCRSLLD